MDRRFNGYNKFNQSHARRGYAREFPGEERYSGRKFDRFSQHGRDKFRGSMLDARDNFRGNMAGFRNQLGRGETEGNFHERHAARDDVGKDSYSENFHERHVDYRKNVHTHKSDETDRGDF
jgi:hypothetical protein